MNSKACLQHPRHEHGLVLRALSQNCSFGCDICGLDASGSLVYQCPECERFLIHQYCAEPVPQIQHPSHPNHPLILSKSSSETNECYGCDLALHRNDSDIYRCDTCNVGLHVVCAIATSSHSDTRLEHEHEDEHKEVTHQHFAHEHPLTSFDVNVSSWIRCKVCRSRISGAVYGCLRCLFILHQSCAFLSRDIPRHPLHPQHELTLQLAQNEEESKLVCQFCDLYCGKFVYRCNECNFSLDVQCARSVSLCPPDDQCDEELGRKEFYHSSHPHPLSSLHTTVQPKIKCELCNKKISGEFYCCPDCRLMIHRSCAELPQEILHPLHPEHPLFYKEENYVSRDIDCHLCTHSNLFSKLAGRYHCEDCSFALDMACAVESLAALKATVADTTQNLITHPITPLRSFRYQIGGVFANNLLNFSREAYYDAAGAPLAHKFEHPFHPQHTLVVMHANSLSAYGGRCGACLGKCSGHILFCGDCEFQMDMLCALLKPTLKHERHEHKLAYFERLKQGKLLCNVCYDNCSIDLYRCVECNYNIHYHCMSLPASVKHELHIHWMELRERVVDDFYDEQYCDLCETVRHPEHAVYYCDECRCASHIDCVIPKADVEKRKRAKEFKLEKLDKEIEKAEAATEQAKEEMEEKLERLDWLKKKREEISSSQIQAQA